MIHNEKDFDKNTKIWVCLLSINLFQFVSLWFHHGADDENVRLRND